MHAIHAKRFQVSYVPFYTRKPQLSCSANLIQCLALSSQYHFLQPFQYSIALHSRLHRDTTVVIKYLVTAQKCINFNYIWSSAVNICVVATVLDVCVAT